MAEFTQAQLDEIYNDLARRGVIQRKPVTQYGNPKFTAGRPVGVHTDGYIPKSLIQTSDLTSLLSGTYANASHAHSGADITTGTVAEARIDAAIARDAEVAAAYSPVGHNHTGVYAPVAHTQAMSTITDYVAATPWTPQLRFGGVAPVGITYSGTPLGRYIRVGGLVWASFDFTLTNKGAQAGNAAIFGLPIAVSAVGSICPILWGAMTTAQIAMYGRAQSSQIDLYGTTAATATLGTIANTAISNTTRLHGTVAYMI